MNRPVGIWLLACCALVLLMVATGGVTRLTHSGLSIVEWKPVTGVLPPLGEAAWRMEFAKYQRTPEYKDVNAGMALESFKAIFWMEYTHRLLGRLAGLVFVLPFLWFAVSGRLSRPLVPRLSVIAFLWAGQGVLGWYMVKSGLVADPHVSHYRLTAHLLAACLLYAAMLWTALGLLRPAPAQRPGAPDLTRLATLVVVLVFVTAASGGLVAGLRAGLIYNTFPKMAGRWFPVYPMDMSPWPVNFLANPVVVQSDHRVLAGALVLSVLGLWLKGRRSARSRLGLDILLAAVFIQATLGALALIYAVPVALGAAHQANLMFLLAAALFARHGLSGQV